MTKRAKRLASFLETELGWSVRLARHRQCPKCSRFAFAESGKFCSNCGAKLPRVAWETEVYGELEAAIAYALGENDDKPCRS